jgi:hypothetical protein
MKNYWWHVAKSYGDARNIGMIQKEEMRKVKRYALMIL